MLRSVRDTLEHAEPLVEGLVAQTADGAELSATRARIAAALAEVDQIQSEMGEAVGSSLAGASEDPEIAVAMAALAEQIAATQKD